MPTVALRPPKVFESKTIPNSHGLNVQSSLQDVAGKTIILEDGTTENKDASFPLKAILISSQFAQGYDFTPKGEVDEYIIYDPTIEGNISMGGSIVPTPTTPSQYTNTLVLQTKDNENVRFALEFENNSGEDFEGVHQESHHARNHHNLQLEGRLHLSARLVRPPFGGGHSVGA